MPIEGRDGMAKGKTVPVPIPAPTIGYITFMSYIPSFIFTCRLGDGSPTVTGGYAKWNDVDRIRRRSLTEWAGAPPISIDIPILFDDFQSAKSIEYDVKQLDLMAGLGLKHGDPPLLGFNSVGVVPHDHKNAPGFDWFIDQISWGDADRNEFGNRTRQAATVTVKQFIEDDTLSDQSAAERKRAAQAAKDRQGQIPKSKLYIVTAEDVKHGGLKWIAKHRLHDPKRWRELAKLNHIRDPKKVHKGQHLRLP